MLKRHREGRVTTVKLSDAEMAAMLHGGATLTEIGARAGITRERVRQRLARIGVRAAKRLDVIKMLEVIRTEPITSFDGLGRALGHPRDAVTRALFELRLIDAVERLFRLRTRAKRRRSRRG
jgi:hypothetical protein